MQFAVDVDPSGSRTVLSVSGDLDVLTAPLLRDRLAESIQAGARDLIVDLTRCDFIDSSGLSALVTALKRIRTLGGDVQLVCPAGHVRRLIEVVALDQVFVLHDDLPPRG